MKTEEFKYLPQIIKRISRVLLEVVVSFFFFGWSVGLNFFILFLKHQSRYGTQASPQRKEHGVTEVSMEIQNLSWKVTDESLTYFSGSTL